MIEPHYRPRDRDNRGRMAESGSRHRFVKPKRFARVAGSNPAPPTTNASVAQSGSAADS